MLDHAHIHVYERTRPNGERERVIFYSSHPGNGDGCDDPECLPGEPGEQEEARRRALGRGA